MRIVKYPHPMLEYQSKPLMKIDQNIRDVVAEMFDLMYETSGVGLAANQVDLPYQIVVINPTGDREQKEQEHVLINPTILKLKGKSVEDEEGCLSFPGLRMIVPRAVEVKFQAVDLSGNVKTFFWKDFMARIVQHETDHLFGTCFYQRAIASLTNDYEGVLAGMKEQFEEDQKKGLEPTQEQFKEYVAKLESERC
jgi:peptide deformylase